MKIHRRYTLLPVSQPNKRISQVLKTFGDLKAHEPQNYSCVSYIWGRSVPGIAVIRGQESPLTWMPERSFFPGGSGVRVAPVFPSPSNIRGENSATGH